ncbi:MAG: hypothetical protein ACREH8_17895 [Opitutaceae bacterium]
MPLLDSPSCYGFVTRYTYVRAGHRLKNILPLRDAMLRAYDAGIAAQR